jgi:hypothetical protein
MVKSRPAMQNTFVIAILFSNYLHTTAAANQMQSVFDLVIDRKYLMSERRAQNRSEISQSRLNSKRMKTKSPVATTASSFKYRKQWEYQFEQLILYKQKFGHCLVPLLKANRTALSHWVNWQREVRRSGKMDPTRESRLSDLGFVWSVGSLWINQYLLLLRFRMDRGHCDVPRRWPPDRHLGSWVSWIRQSRRRQLGISDDRVRMLDALGFRWEFPEHPAAIAAAHRAAALRTSSSSAYGGSELDPPPPPPAARRRRRRAGGGGGGGVVLAAAADGGRADAVAARREGERANGRRGAAARRPFAAAAAQGAGGTLRPPARARPRSLGAAPAGGCDRGCGWDDGGGEGNWAQ